MPLGSIVTHSALPVAPLMLSRAKRRQSILKDALRNRKADRVKQAEALEAYMEQEHQ